MPRLLIAPTEPALLKSLGEVSGWPEEMGCDVLISCRHIMAGVQRKDTNDLLASIADGRLQKERLQAAELYLKWLIVEGSFGWNPDGTHLHRRFTRKQIRRYIISMELEGWMTLYTASLAETCEVILDLASEVDKPQRNSLVTRGKPSASDWLGAGPPRKEDFLVSLLTAVPGWSAVTARSVVKAAMGNGAPLTLRSVIERPDEWFLGVRGLGKVRLAKLREVLG